MVNNKKKKIALISSISLGVVFILALCFVGYKNYDIKKNVVDLEDVTYEKMHSIYLNGDSIALILEDDLKSDKYTFRFLSEKEGDNSNNIYVLKENIENIDLSVIANTYDYYKKIEYPLSNYLVDFYLKNIMKVQDEDSIKDMNVSINATEKEDKTGSVMEIRIKDKETFKYNIDFEDDFAIKISY